MAEPELAAALIAIATAGIKLSIKLYTFSETVATASSEIKDIARDVSLTSSLLEQLGSSLRTDSQDDSDATLASGSAVQTAQDAVNECEIVFGEIDDVLAKATASVSKKWPKKGGKVALSPADRPKWPFLQPRVVLLRGNLERVKSALVLLVAILMYAEEKHAEDTDAPREDDIYQKTLLENLFLANQQATTKYENLLKILESQGENALTQDSTTPSDLDWTVRDSLKRVERSLIQFERSAPISYGTSRMTVQIELEKEAPRSSSRDTRGRPNPPTRTPWTLLSVERKEREISPSYNESWIPSEKEMYNSFAGGALEGLTVEDDRSRSRSRSRVRFQDQYQENRSAQPGPSRRTDAYQAEIDETVGLMHENIGRGSQRGNRVDSLNNNGSDPMGTGAAQFRKGAPKTKTWYSSLLGSIPSPTLAISSIQRAAQNSGIFFGMDEEKERSDTVLEYRGSRLASPPPPLNSPGAKIQRSSTFDEMLRSPSSEGQFTPPSTVVSAKEAPVAAKHVETEIHAPKPVSAVGSTPIEQKIPFLVPAENETGDHSGRTTPDVSSKAEKAALLPEEQSKSGQKDLQSSDGNNDLGGSAAPGTTAAEEDTSEKTEVVRNSKGKGKAKEVVSQGQPDDVEQLLEEWTNIYRG